MQSLSSFLGGGLRIRSLLLRALRTIAMQYHKRRLMAQTDWDFLLRYAKVKDDKGLIPPTRERCLQATTATAETG